MRHPRETGRRLGDFTILGELGRGGMGVVYRARQESMGRIVALKTLPAFAGMDQEAVMRFRREAGAAGRLSHPGIVPIYAVGEAEGVHYYAMELVDGPSLSSLLDGLAGRSPERLRGTIAEEAGSTDLRTASIGESISGGATSRYAHSCASIAAELASALATAHRGMVIHRDLKPSNVLIRENGRPVLVDFGLARDELTLGLTQSGDALGTPAYMAPEQARGVKDLDARVDIYGLGALLYEMLTLRPPFDGRHPAEILHKIVEQDPIPVRQLNPRVPVDLEKIVHTCLAKNPDDRYVAAETVEMDLRAFLEGREVIARRPRLVDRLARAVRRDRKALLVGLVVLTLTSVGFGVMGVVAERRAERDGERALAEAREAVRGLRFDEAQETYGRARALLGDGPVDAARWQHLQSAFDEIYTAGRFEALGAYLESWAQAERSGAWRRFAARIEGRGRIEVVGAGDADVEIRRAAGDEWRPWSADERLPLGEYLVRVSRPDAAVTAERVVVERDAKAVVRPLLVDRDAVPGDMVLVADPMRGGGSLVQRTELSRERFERFLQSVPDPVLRAELVPAGWDADGGGEPDLPVTGLSFAQARTLAALCGFHLLSEREYGLAATAGLSELRYPWGPTFDAGVVAADPGRLASPLPVRSKESGASPHGVLHLVGNVADMIAPPFGSRDVPVAGGHYQSPPEELTCDGRQWLEGLDAQKSWVGLRFARFAPVRRDVARVRRLERLERDMFETGRWALLHDWTVRGDGRVELDVRLLGRQVDTVERQSLPLVTEGFAQVGEFVVVDGFGRPIEVEREVSDFGDVARVDLDYGRPIARGQQFQIRLSTELEPRSGLVGRGDVYSLHVPLKTVHLLRSMIRVELPQGCGIESVEPEPDESFDVGGAPVLVWHFDADLSGALAMPAVVRFRRDGPMTDTWPASQRVVAEVARLLHALSNGDRTQLEDALAEEFRLRPHMWSREHLLRVLDGAGVRVGRIEDCDVVDVVAVSDIVTAWVDVDWTLEDRDGAEIRLRRWPLRVLLRRDGDRFEAVEIAPAGTTDRGTLETDCYRHAGLGFEIRPPQELGVRLRRADGHMAEMQVVCLPAGDAEGISYAVFGLRAAIDDDPDEIRHRLTDGAWSMRRGQGLDGSRVGVLGSLELAAETRSLHWMFPLAGGRGFDRETWTILQRGQRWFLARSRARAPTETEATELFRRHRVFFDAMARSISILD